MCRTIVVGKEKELVDCFLILISYFIRCSQVHLRKQNEEIIFEFGDSSLHFTSEEGQSFVSTNPVDTTTLQVIELEFPPIGNQPLDEQQSLCRSLFASYCDRYCSDFVLMGLKPSYDLVPLIAQDLKAWVNHPPLRPELALGHTACIVIDTDNNLCEIYTYDPQNEIPIDWKGGSVEGIWCYKMSSIPAIDSMLNTLDSLWSSHSFPPEACVMFMEEKLNDIMTKTKILKRFKDQIASREDLAKMIGVSIEDIPFLSILGTRTQWLE